MIRHKRERSSPPNYLTFPCKNRTYHEHDVFQARVPMPAEASINSSSSSPIIDESDIDALLLEFKGDVREAIRALLHDIAILADDRDNSVSYGYVRGRLFRKMTSQTDS